MLVVGLLSIPGTLWSMDRFDVVSTQEMKKLLDDRTQGKIDFLLVNGLDEIMYRHAAIPGSINVPWPRVEEVGPERLGNDKNRLIIMH
jgi:hypothetical protein